MREYFKNSPAPCPKCGSTHTVRVNLTRLKNRLKNRVLCRDCDGTFYIYRPFTVEKEAENVN